MPDTRFFIQPLHAAIVLLALGAPAFAQNEQPTDPSSARPIREEPADAPKAIAADPRITTEGRDRRVWPPDPLFNHRRFLLDMVMPDMSKHEFTATATILVDPIAIPRDRITLDAGPGLTFSAVRVNKKPALFTRAEDKQKLTIEFGRAFKPGESIELAMDYAAVKPGGRGDGLTWSRDDRRTPEVDFMVHVQGEPQNNHLWFPCHDFPNVRVSTEMKVTVPEPYEAVSNGKLLSVNRKSYASLGLTPPAPQLPSRPADEEQATEAEPSPTHLRTFHWKQELPHVYYLQTLIISRFDVVNVGGPKSERPGLWIPVYGPLGSGEALRKSYANTPAMIDHFSKLLQYDYPWDKYAQVLCRDFSAGAMENTGTVTFAATMGLNGRRGGIDSIISHELMHHWFGDLITCKGWEHLWLNEGWATMGEALWAEKVRGEDGYHAAILRNFERERTSSRNRNAPARPGMVTNLYTNPDSRFTSGDNVYSKGGSILHMLRMRLGDEAFFTGVRNYLQKHAFGLAETDDFRIMLEESSGQSLERFFDQWCRRPGHPALEVDLSWEPATSGDGGSLNVTIEQTQRIDADNPAYALSIPIWITKNEEGDQGEWRSVVIDTKKAVASFPMAFKPKDVEVDPSLTVLSRRRIRQPLTQALHRLDSNHATLASRLDAINTLAENPDPRAAATLARLSLPRTIWSDDPYIDDPGVVQRQAARQALAAQLNVMTTRATSIASALLTAPEGRQSLAVGVHPRKTPALRSSPGRATVPPTIRSHTNSPISLQASPLAQEVSQ